MFRSRARSRSALAVLEALARARLTVLLAFLLARVAREEAGALDRRAALRVDRDEGARDAVTHRFGLGRVPTAFDRRPDVVLVDDLDELERLAHDHARRVALEVVVGGLAVDGHLAAA